MPKGKNISAQQTSPPVPTPPCAKRRVLVVGKDAQAQRLGRSIAAVDPSAIIVTAPSYLCAIGEIAVTEVDVIVGPVVGMSGLVEPIATSLRRLAPHARLVVVADNPDDEEVAHALSAGFDDCLLRPIDPLHLAQAIGADDLDSKQTEIADTASVELPDEELGDVDLVDAILDGHGAMRDRAFRLLRAKCGLQGLAWSSVEESVPPGHVSSSVQLSDHNYGSLHAPPPVTSEQLGPWAAWLARWLALDDQVEQLKVQAMRDELTGAWNRRYFNRFLERILRKATDNRSQVTLMVFDIDDFKLYNDSYGHGAGDEILREAARLMLTVVREHDVVARIGGDEFAVIFWDAEGPRRPNSAHPHDVATAARRFQRAICTHKYPKLLDQAPGTLTISGGLASFPWDGRTPQDLLQRADAMALQSKKQGKNAITFGPGAARICELEI